MKIALENVGPGVVEAAWNPALLPPKTEQIQFRRLSSLSPGNEQIGFDILQNVQSIQTGRTRLIVESDKLLIVVAVPITDDPYADIEGGIPSCIVPQ